MTQYSGKIIRKNAVVPTQQSASGVWTVTDAAAATRNNAWPVAGVPDPISRSCRFRASATAYFNRTFTTPTNNLIWSWSSWIKRGALGTAQHLMGTGTLGTGADQAGITLGSDNTLYLYQTQTGTGSYEFIVQTTQVLRDPSAWYHIFFVYDSTQATSSNRIKLYINGVQVTAFTTATYPSLNLASRINAARSHDLGRYGSGVNYFDGYMTEVNFIDGQQLTPSSFGTTDAFTGAWVPMAYTGTYGTNGFYLNFKDNTSTTTLGYDYSGNSNNWTANNISLTAGSTYDSMLDVPTPWIGYSATTDTSAVTRGNYCVVNPLKKSASATITDGNLTVAINGVGGEQPASFALSSGKWYWEVSPNAAYSAPGIILTSRTPSASSIANDYHYYGNNGQFYTNTSGVAYGATFGNGDVIGVALDLDTNQITFYKNGTSQGAKTIVAGEYNPDFAGATTVTNYANFGQRPFSQSVPAGFKTLCTTNLPEPTIKLGASYMAATTLTGTGASQVITNGGNNTTSTTFQPDLVWIKPRNEVASNRLVDSVRGVNQVIYTNQTAAETTESVVVSSFNSNGFTGAGPNAVTSGYNAVAWQWKANGSAVSNTNGTITSQVNAGTTQGFSVVTYTGSGSSATVGHGLGVSPSMVIIKRRNSTGNWIMYHTSLGDNKYIYLNSTAAAVSASSSWSVSSSTVGLTALYTDYNESGGTYVAYCFAEVAGYSKFGSYTGNGSTDGPFVYCGFRPRFVLMKRTDTGGTDWIMWDSSRNTYNVVNAYLAANLSAAETTAYTNNLLDFVSNGFKIRQTASGMNASGGTYIYACFAENPFKYSNAR